MNEEFHRVNLHIGMHVNLNCVPARIFMRVSDMSNEF